MAATKRRDFRSKYQACKKLRSLSICLVWPVSSKLERMNSQNWFWPEWPCSWIRAAQFSRSGRPKRGNLESCGGKNVRELLGPFHLNWPEPEPILVGQPERTDWKATSVLPRSYTKVRFQDCLEVRFVIF